MSFVNELRQSPFASCPLKSSGRRERSADAVYSWFIETVTQFRELSCLPVPFEIASDIDSNMFIRNHAKWHKSCHLTFSTSKLEREKRERKGMRHLTELELRDATDHASAWRGITVYFATTKREPCMNSAL